MPPAGRKVKSVGAATTSLGRMLAIAIPSGAAVGGLVLAILLAAGTINTSTPQVSPPVPPTAGAPLNDINNSAAEETIWEGDEPGPDDIVVDPENIPPELEQTIGCLDNYIDTFGDPEVLNQGTGEAFDRLMDDANFACSDTSPPPLALEDIVGDDDNVFIFEGLVEE